ncbi:MAG: hypothetical protein AAF922_00205 [Pseudomonadota bacterium]
MKKNGKSNRKSLKVSLSTVALMLISSAFLRLGSDTGQAVALNAEENNDMVKTPMNEQFSIIDDDGIRQMLVAIKNREKEIETKEQKIQNRLRALEQVDAEVSEKIDQLERVEKKLRSTLTIAQTAADADIERLTQVYENMKPKQAAALFEEMDPNFAAGFLGRMRSDAAAAIMAGLSAESANLYSVILAGRNANAPKE